MKGVSTACEGNSLDYTRAVASVLVWYFKCTPELLCIKIRMRTGGKEPGVH
jgi:hypothetical protein